MLQTFKFELSSAIAKKLAPRRPDRPNSSDTVMLDEAAEAATKHANHASGL